MEHPQTGTSARQTDTQPRPSAPPEEAPAPLQLDGDMGIVQIKVVDPEGIGVRSRVEFHDAPAHLAFVVEVPRGHIDIKAPTGTYIAYLQAYEMGAPFTVDVRPIEILKGKPFLLTALVVEGRTAAMPTLKDFDPDIDLATTNAEIAAGTDPMNVLSVPGRKTITYDSKVLHPEAGWYAGDLFVHSTYGRGSESVAELVARAEKAGLDFLAITDLNTMAAMDDPGFKSDKVVLIPAMAWGNEDRGVAIIYGPGTVPAPPGSLAAAQSICGLAQAQGGVFAVAHPCFDRAPWQWGLAYVNAIQVWCGDWRATPPIPLGRLKKGIRERKPDSEEMLHAIAAAVKGSEAVASHVLSPGMLAGLGASQADAVHLQMSANMQAEIFLDIELRRGLMAGVMGGSDSDGPKIPLGEPLTYVYAREKSLAGIMEGLRLGRTFISRGPDGPKVLMRASFLGPGDIVDKTKPHIFVGGVVPLDTRVQFEVIVTNAKGLKLEILRDGKPSVLKQIESDNFGLQFKELMAYRGNIRARVVGRPKNLRAGYGVREVHAMTSPIFIRNVFYETVPGGSE